MKLQIADVMTAMPVTIGVDCSLAEARALMDRHQIRHLPVMKLGRLVGIVSERELDLLLTAPEIDGDNAAISRAMTTGPLVVAPGDAVDVVAERMAELKVGSAVVVRRDQILGMFTTTDALRALADVTKSRLP